MSAADSSHFPRFVDVAQGQVRRRGEEIRLGRLPADDRVFAVFRPERAEECDRVLEHLLPVLLQFGTVGPLLARHPHHHSLDSLDGPFQPGGGLLSLFFSLRE